MKTQKIITGIVFALAMTPFLSTAQDENQLPELAVDQNTYRTAIGLRAGETSGLTIKQFIGGPNAIEGIIGAWNHGFSLTLLYERHTTAFNVSELNWYYGIGGHASVNAGRFIYYKYPRNYGRYEYYTTGTVGLGIDGIFGLEYQIPNTPLAASFDLKPYVELFNTGGYWMSLDPGIGFKVKF